MSQELLFIWDAFWDLTTERRNQEGYYGPIIWTAMNEYAYRYNINDPNKFDSFVFFIKGIDAEYRDIKHKEIKRQREMNKSKGSAGKGRR